MTDDQKKTENEHVPAWIEFARLGNPKEILAAVQSFFLSDAAGVGAFEKRFGINLNDFPGFYLEVATTDAPRGPLLAGKVKPILVLRQSEAGGSFTPHIMHHEGLLNHEQTRAWIRSEEWDDYVQDTFFQEMVEDAKRRRAVTEEAAKQLMEMHDEVDGETVSLESSEER